MRTIFNWVTWLTAAGLAALLTLVQFGFAVMLDDYGRLTPFWIVTSVALLWKFGMPEMPEGAQSSAKEQLYLTLVSGDHVILLNGVVEGDVSEEAVQKFLLDAASTFKASAKPINLRELQETIRKGSTQ